ncbi:MAG: DUF4296 domain-containing protein [Bacteroidales bacterium]|nr:DUF4296 domain-containing protein [Bacteroidales bacterium]
MNRCKLLALLLVLLSASCQSSKRPEGVLDAEQMSAFLTEAYLLEGYYSVATHYAYDSLPQPLEGAYAALLDSLGISRQQVEASLTYYAEHASDYATIQEEVAARLDTLR